MIFHGSLMKNEKNSVDNCDTIFYSKERTKKIYKSSWTNRIQKNN